ncbi:acetoacetyl-CoA synthetase-like [Uloborus diversus]|uniref:acetoacetyl-CoA synthetase-like n=1 Tax=Uloborus diversus TaxID=327109 RepID=UPI002409539E|nr:acetoacetyl-CoA synthetase-like [Uloborus diversus]
MRSTEFMASCITFDHTLKINRGEITCASLGIDIQILDESGKPLMGEAGDMVVIKPIPSLPVGIWEDEDGSRFKETYFSKFPGKFSMGDLGMINPVTKGFVICGRSDDTLKPGGCRFGSSEIYDIVDKFPEVRDSLCVSQYSAKGVERAVLFLKMKSGHCCDQILVDKLRAMISRELSSRHVPEIIIETADIPYNLNGKKMEIVVKNIINGRKYSAETVINPECLQNFFNFPELSGF